ncbi:MAG: hypothetical protein LC118_13215 [Dehalococcoidia bacterium]|nr:hypothetical protein [Dehalococcoidia bacterium]
MTAQPHASVRLRARPGNVFSTPRENWTSLEDSLGLVVLYAQARDPRFERAAARWLSQLVEQKALAPQEVALAANALLALRGRVSGEAAQLLSGIARTETVRPTAR